MFIVEILTLILALIFPTDNMTPAPMNSPIENVSTIQAPLDEAMSKTPSGHCEHTIHNADNVHTIAC